MSKPVSTPSTEGARSDWKKARNSILGIVAVTTTSALLAAVGAHHVLLHNAPSSVSWLYFGLACAYAVFAANGVREHRRQFYPESLTPKP